ncbi:hypothetical protein FVE85_7390 [Porphyridium purpureum]|uniref:Uncharacterized protein n=1 Tax=Porphyridium purpureum TaxID=35688 RepID=A0A5J4Z902_PORPP|nr:hypothetical protein FVE85_7390 [Porphyridium purpureum]|eukprot:POR5983..scf295_1
MNWSTPQLISLASKNVPSVQAQNFVHDGDGRFAFVAGRSVMCTRKSPKTYLGQSVDYELALKVPHEFVEITSLEFWPHKLSSSRPFLVVATDRHFEHQARISVFDTYAGNGTEIASYSFGQDYVEEETSNGEEYSSGSINWMALGTFSRSKMVRVGQVKIVLSLGFLNHSRNFNQLIVGTDNGLVLLFALVSPKTLRLTAIVDKSYDLPVYSVSGNLLKNSPTIAACDDKGKAIVWRYTNENWAKRYTTTGESYDDMDAMDQDLAGIVRIFGDVLLIGRHNGFVEGHNIDTKTVIWRISTCTMPVSSIDIHIKLHLLLVAGEDGRCTILQLPSTRSGTLYLEPAAAQDDTHVMLSSFALNGIVLGARFARFLEDNVDFVVCVAERPYLLKYEYSQT